MSSEQAAKKTTRCFDTFDANLALDPKARKRAQDAHRDITDRLVTDGVASGSRLQGSFARKTMLPPLHDVDKVIELHPDHHALVREPGGTKAAMDLIRDSVKSLLPTATFHIKRHALGIFLPEEGFDFDAVPAINDGIDPDWIVIANTDDDTWDESNTYQLIAVVAARNQACNGQFIHQVRMLKEAAKAHGLAGVLPGLHIESFAFQAITTQMEHPAAIAGALTKGAVLLGGGYYEPTGFDRISDRLLESDKIVAKRIVLGLADKANEALASDDVAAVRIWADIFGEKFPRLPAGNTAFLAGLSTGAAAKPTPRTRAWSPA